jgi:hypothetical protein
MTQTIGCRNERAIAEQLFFTMKIPTSACGGKDDKDARMERSDIRDYQARMIGCGRNTLLLLAGNLAHRRTRMSLRSIRATR